MKQNFPEPQRIQQNKRSAAFSLMGKRDRLEAFTESTVRRLWPLTRPPTSGHESTDGLSSFVHSMNLCAFFYTNACFCLLSCMSSSLASRERHWSCLRRAEQATHTFCTHRPCIRTTNGISPANPTNTFYFRRYQTLQVPIVLRMPPAPHPHRQLSNFPNPWGKGSWCCLNLCFPY